jgi:hypothetical protein
MTPQEIEQLKREVGELKAWKKSLESTETIPSEIVNSFTYRFTRNTPSVSSKSASSENESIDENGVALHSVLKSPDGFLIVTINSIDYFLPYYG